MLYFAAASVDRMKQIPQEFWVKLAIGIGVLVLAVVLLRKIARINKVVLGVGAMLVLTFIGFSWIYERNEPAWATPVVQWLAGFFPTKRVR